jgi:hypothetical protein
VVGAEQQLDAPAQLGVAGTSPVEKRRAVFRRLLLEGLEEDGFFVHEDDSWACRPSHTPL